MTAEIINGITIMPHEFDFSKVNSLCNNMIYHAKRKGISGDYYIITWEIDNRTITDKMYYKRCMVN